MLLWDLLIYPCNLILVYTVVSHISQSLADGLALGAAAGLSKVDVQLIIFLAIMLHKVN
jgi:TRAP-type mannitol/chloroaromatic compound transport system permease small subunit